MAISLAPFNNLANRFSQFHIKKMFFLPKSYVDKFQKSLKDYKLPTLFSWIHHYSHSAAFVFLMYWWCISLPSEGKLHTTWTLLNALQTSVKKKEPPPREFPANPCLEPMFLAVKTRSPSHWNIRKFPYLFILWTLFYKTFRWGPIDQFFFFLLWINFLVTSLRTLSLSSQRFTPVFL